MPWWFWIITHVWVACSTAMSIHLVEEGDFSREEHWVMIIFLCAVCLLGPISFIIGFTGATWQDYNIWEKIKDKWLIRKLRKCHKWFKERKQRKKDFKECDDNEDEWRIERLGIK